MAYRQDLAAFTLNQIRSGKLMEEASEKLNSLVGAIQDTNLAGELTLKIKIRPDGRDTGRYFISGKVDTKTPVLKHSETLLFGTPDGNLTRIDPAQSELDLREVTAQRKPATIVDEPAIPARVVS
jgi:hypothetical protein